METENIPKVFKLNKAIKYAIICLVITIIGLLLYDYIRITPHNVHFTNISSTSVTVSWSTKSPVVGSVVYKDSKNIFPLSLMSLGRKRFYDTRDVKAAELLAAKQTEENIKEGGNLTITMDDVVSKVFVTKQGRYYTHHVVVTGLDPQTEYSFMIGGALLYRNIKDIEINKIVLTDKLPEDVVTPIPAYGTVKDAENREDTKLSNLKPITDAVVYFNYYNESTGERSRVYSSSMNESGNWYLDVSDAVDENGTHFMNMFGEEGEELSVVEFVVDAGPKGIWKQKALSSITSPMPLVVINDPLSSNNEEYNIIKTSIIPTVLVKGMKVYAADCNFANYCGPCYGSSLYDECPCPVSTLEARGCDGEDDKTMDEAIKAVEQEINNNTQEINNNTIACASESTAYVTSAKNIAVKNCEYNATTRTCYCRTTTTDVSTMDDSELDAFLDSMTMEQLIRVSQGYQSSTTTNTTTDTTTNYHKADDELSTDNTSPTNTTNTIIEFRKADDDLLGLDTCSSDQVDKCNPNGNGQQCVKIKDDSSFSGYIYVWTDVSYCNQSGGVSVLPCSKEQVDMCNDAGEQCVKVKDISAVTNSYNYQWIKTGNCVLGKESVARGGECGKDVSGLCNQKGERCGGDFFLGYEWTYDNTCFDFVLANQQSSPTSIMYVPKHTPLNFLRDKLSSLFKIYKVFAQTTSQYVLDSQNGLFLYLTPGTYTFEYNNATYSFVKQSNPLATIVYIDTNDNETYDKGVDTLVSDLASEVNIVPTEQVFEYNLVEGFNFVSFPFLISDDEYRTAASVLKGLNETYGDIIYSISKYDGTWKVVGQNVEIYDTNDFQLIPGQGYILKSKVNIKIRIAGKPIQYESTSDSVPITLFEGWNLVGLYGTNVKAYTAKSMIQDINAYTDVDFTSDNVSKWDSNVQRYDGFQLSQEDGVEQEYGFDYPLSILQSYFVRVKEGNGNWQPQLAQ